MKPVLAWVKANLWIPVFSLIAVVVLAGGWVGSSAWNKNIRTAREKKAQDFMARLKVNVAYTELAMEPNETPIARTEAPNERVTEWFRARRAQQLEQGQKVIELAEQRNRADHRPLLEGLLPEPPPGELQARTLQFVRMLVPGARGGEPSAFEALLRNYGGIGPPSAEQIAAVLRDVQQREKDRLRAGARTGEEISAEEEQVIEKKLVDQRIGEYRRRADQGSFYATIDMSFPRTSGTGTTKVGPVIPREIPATPPSLEQCFAWQFDYWVVSDVLKAIETANTDAGGSRTLVPDSIVKRIINLQVENIVPTYAPDLQITTIADAQSGLIPPDHLLSVTGRGMLNHLYDVRRVDLYLIVAIDRLPVLLDALANTNFISITDLDLSEVDVWADLGQGFYYGPDPVMRVEMELEMIYLRSWTSQFMPSRVKELLAVPQAPEDEFEDPGLR